jgi:hypothetical protein
MLSELRAHAFKVLGAGAMAVAALGCSGSNGDHAPVTTAPEVLTIGQAAAKFLEIAGPAQTSATQFNDAVSASRAEGDSAPLKQAARALSDELQSATTKLKALRWPTPTQSPVDELANAWSDQSAAAKRLSTMSQPSEMQNQIGVVQAAATKATSAAGVIRQQLGIPGA